MKIKACLRWIIFFYFFSAETETSVAVCKQIDLVNYGHPSVYTLYALKLKSKKRKKNEKLKHMLHNL